MTRPAGTHVAIVGAGAVGATIAYACLIRGVTKKLSLYDVSGDKARAEVLDLNHGAAFVPVTSITGGDDIGICEDADIVVVTAGAKQKPGQTRLDLAAANVEMCHDLLPKLLDVAPDALLLVVTNPVDVITYAALRISGLSPHRVFGSGTVLDSARFRYLIAEHLSVAVPNVHAAIAGEHGDSEIPLWSSASIGTIGIDAWDVPGRRLTAEDREQIASRVVSAAYEIIQGKGATNYAIGLAVAQILEAVLGDENRVLSVSSLLRDYQGIDDVCLSVPSLVNRRGVEVPLDVPLSDLELAGLRASGGAVRQVCRDLGL